jgi:cellobiose phosphorylase
MITKKTIEENSDYEIRHYTGYTEFGACSCSNEINCDCRKDFIPQKVEHYTLTVIKHTGKRTKSKTFYYNTLQEVNNKLTNKLRNHEKN